MAAGKQGAKKHVHIYYIFLFCNVVSLYVMQPLRVNHTKQSSDLSTQWFQAGLIAMHSDYFTKKGMFFKLKKKFYIDKVFLWSLLTIMVNCELVEISFLALARSPM